VTTTNTQQPVGSNVDPDGKLNVHSMWETIQGEGPYAGVPAVFVRLWGCNLLCSGCDTDYTSKRKQYGPVELAKAIKKIRRSPSLVVFTGGEPMRQNIAPAVLSLLVWGFNVQIETNGTLFVSGLPYDANSLTVVCSPKTVELNKRLIPHIGALKYVVQDRHIDPVDGLPLRVLNDDVRVWRPPADFVGDIFIQPYDSGNYYENANHIKAAVASCLKHNHRLCLQVHKLCGLD